MHGADVVEESLAESDLRLEAWRCPDVGVGRLVWWRLEFDWTWNKVPGSIDKLQSQKSQMPAGAPAAAHCPLTSGRRDIHPHGKPRVRDTPTSCCGRFGANRAGPWAANLELPLGFTAFEEHGAVFIYYVSCTFYEGEIGFQ